ncbi:phosphate acyltransferase PlsX [Natribacillus halophilus]|uniref:Phosphate acyltransferase n=1 Tax=Natribacillus halophilus TaxID=549003 RepID=A0A1G8MK68_9BACI|nr:phosphate acyltransferase PlsX [Natribacillus halophilus]SDI67710.1 phosphate:acyl-[acyl carrier protein] acyltransferase [Natribacillus halophilus]
MKIAIDAMGGDHAPKAQVAGTLAAVRAFEDLEVTLVGDEEKIQPHLSGHDRIKLLHTTSVIENDEMPTQAVRRKKDSSMVLAVREVRENRADACISAGNTGALMSSGLLQIGRIEGLERPALAPMLPTLDGEGFLLLDVGANIEARAAHLLQYGIMGDVYMRKVKNRKRPRVGLLNIGAEEGKGNELTKQAYEQMQDADFEFVGNVEARDVLNGGCDVVVCDGFSGNIVLKSIEGTAESLFSILKSELASTMKNKMAAAVLKPSFKNVQQKLSYSHYGGAGLFGLKAPVVKAHGSSDHTAFFHAIRQARQMVSEEVAHIIAADLQKQRGE